MSRKIYFIIDTPIVKSYTSYYLLDAFLQYNVEYVLVDVSPMINKRAYKTVKNELVDYDKDNVYLCENIKTLENIVDSMPSDAIVIDSGGYNLDHLKIYRRLWKKNIAYGYMILNSCFETATAVRGIHKVLSFIKRFRIKRAANSIFIRLPKKWFGAQACSFVINNSVKEVENYKKRFFCDEHTKFLVVHSNSYEEALEKCETERIVEQKYCVWLDSYIPYHPDLAQIPGAHVDAESYYGTLRQFFHWIENEYGIKVVIAAHPRSDYNEHKEAYEGFKIYEFSTCVLVRDAEFVLSAASTSFLYAIMYMKPVLFIYQTALAEGLPSHISFIKTLSEEVGTQPLRIDGEKIKKEDVDKLLIINREYYKNIADEYIRKDFDGKIEGESYKQQIISFLQQI